MGKLGRRRNLWLRVFGTTRPSESLRGMTRVRNGRDWPSAPRSGKTKSNGTPVAMEPSHCSSTFGSVAGSSDALRAPAFHLLGSRPPVYSYQRRCTSRSRRPVSRSRPVAGSRQPKSESVPRSLGVPLRLAFARSHRARVTRPRMRRMARRPTQVRLIGKANWRHLTL
jgi:hypothetical protein